jgi:integrase
MELAYLCRARANEVYKLKVSDITEQGLKVIRGKGSEGEYTQITARLQRAIDAALAWHKDAPTPVTGAYLLHDKHGKKYTMANHSSQMGRLKAKMIAKGIEPFTFHDLKAKGYSDQKKQDAGHKSTAMHKTYNRKLRVVTPAENGQEI